MNLFDLLFPKYCLECKKEGQYICDECMSKVTPYGRVGNNYSVFKYEGVIRKAIISLKYKFATDVAEELVSRLVGSLISNKNLVSSYCLVPIPLHRRRENWRGFNQAELLGKKLAEKMKWEFLPDLLIRHKNTIPQVGLKGLVRRSNISDAFSVNLNHNTYNIIHNTVVLFDDVYTTGSTIKEAKQVLRVAGFKKIYSLTIAR